MTDKAHGQSLYYSNDATHWSSQYDKGTTAGVSFIGWDFGSGQLKAVDKFRIKQAQICGTTSVKVQYSNDKSNWNNAWTATNLDRDYQSFQTSEASVPAAQIAAPAVVCQTLSSAWRLWDSDYLVTGRKRYKDTTKGTYFVEQPNGLYAESPNGSQNQFPRTL